jgi:hypothetical protein
MLDSSTSRMNQVNFSANNGVFCVTTDRHGGILIREDVAPTLLSPQAIKIGESDGTYLCFEEDCAASAPLYEHPEWYRWYADHEKPEAEVKQEEAEQLRRWYPEYFRSIEDDSSPN